MLIHPFDNFGMLRLKTERNLFNNMMYIIENNDM